MKSVEFQVQNFQHSMKKMKTFTDEDQMSTKNRMHFEYMNVRVSLLKVLAPPDIALQWTLGFT